MRSVLALMGCIAASGALGLVLKWAWSPRPVDDVWPESPDYRGFDMEAEARRRRLKQQQRPLGRALRFWE